MSLSPPEAERFGIVLNRDGLRRSAFELLSYPHVGWEDLVRAWPELTDWSPAIVKQVTTEARYAVYLERQAEEAARLRRDEALDLSVSTGVTSRRPRRLSQEIRIKLQQIRPRSIGQAQRIEGMTPAALMILAARARRSTAPGSPELWLGGAMSASGSLPAHVSRETLERLNLIAAQVRKWQPRINLVAPSTLETLWERHIEDSMQLLPLAPPAFKTWLDLGSGGGFPALVVAALCADDPDQRFVLVESNGKKCSFLRETARLAGLRVEVKPMRIEDFAAVNRQHFDVVSARRWRPCRFCWNSLPLSSAPALSHFFRRDKMLMPSSPPHGTLGIWMSI